MKHDNASQANRAWLVCITAFFIFCSVAIAQSPSGSISGVVQDESGAVVPKASVTVTNVDTGVTRSAHADAAGRYHAAGLIPGHYEIQAQVTGFETVVRRGLQKVLTPPPSSSRSMPAAILPRWRTRSTSKATGVSPHSASSITW